MEELRQEVVQKKRISDVEKLQIFNEQLQDITKSLANAKGKINFDDIETLLDTNPLTI